MQIKQAYLEFSRLSEYLQSLGLLLARIAVAYGFYEPAMMKWSDMGAVAQWFGSMGIPLSTSKWEVDSMEYETKQATSTKSDTKNLSDLPR